MVIRQISSGKKNNFIVISVADPDPGSGAFLTPGSGMGKKSRSGCGSLETNFWVKNT
jgi:hypothetical protein